MNRRTFLRNSTGALGAASLARGRAPDRPNILLITDDQHNARNLGCAGDPLVKTPNLDRLAARGVRFTRAYAQGMICAPSRVSMLTGQYVHSHGYYGNNGPHRDWPLWLTSYLRNNGYQTALMGKAHYGYERMMREFDFVRFCDRIDTPPDNPLKNDYFRMLAEKGHTDDYDGLMARRRGQNNPFQSLLPKELSLEWWTGDTTIEFLNKRDRSKPFFAFMSFERPHAPITPPAPYATMYDPVKVELPPSFNDSFEGKPAEQLRAAKRSGYPYHPTDPAKLREIIAMYFGLITSIDDNVGRVLAELDRQGLSDNTLVIFTSDHGDFSGEHGFFHKNMGMYEAIHRIPFLMAGPGIPAGQVREDLVEQVDIFPTACGFAGLPVPKSIQGLSLIAPRKGPWPRTAAFGEREDRKCVRTARYRMVYDPAGAANELYDYASDPWEMKNLYTDPRYRDVRLELMETFLRFYARTEFQTNANTNLKNSERDAMPPGPTHDLWWNYEDWDTVKRKYSLGSR